MNSPLTAVEIVTVLTNRMLQRGFVPDVKAWNKKNIRNVAPDTVSYHDRFRNILNDCPLLRGRVQSYANDSDKNKALRRAFEKAYKLIRTRTDAEQYFCGLTFHVDSSVLIPRQDTETAVETALPYLTPDSRVLDLCTGSGCIIITLAKQAGLRDAAGSDISGKALAIAARNARELGCPDIRFIQSDLFEKITGRYDMIISNPPYIPSDVIGGLMQEVRDHEPHSALDGGADGLDFYREITAQAGAHLTPGGILLTEIGYDQGETAAALFEEAGFADVKAVRDLAGNNRVVYGRYVHV